MEQSICHCEKKQTLRTEEEKKKLLNRLSRIEGQVRGLMGMIEREAYCADILTQSTAIRAAVDGFNRDLLSLHLYSCVERDIRAGKSGAVDELCDLLKKMLR